MFIRRKKIKSSTAVQIVENYKEGKLHKKKIIRHVGTFSTNEQEQHLISMAQKIIVDITAAREAEEVVASPSDLHAKISLRDFKVVGNINAALHHIYGKIFKDTGFDKLLKDNIQCHNYRRCLEDVILLRLAEPASKLKTSQILRDKYGISHEDDSLYRAMDCINQDFIEKIQETAYNNTKKLNDGTVDILFYDCTTIYFESFKEDGLRKCGFSKDHKHNQTQVLMAIIVTSGGLPIGYKIFPGNKYEGHTLLPAIDEIKSKYDVARIVVVADSGLMNANNTKQLHIKNCEYIIGAKIKNMNKKIMEKIQDLNLYTEHSNTTKDRILTQTIKLSDDKTLVLSYSSLRARKDEQDRNKIIERIKEKLANSNDQSNFITNGSYKKYTKKITITTSTEDSEKDLSEKDNESDSSKQQNIVAEIKLELDQSKVDHDKKWDGIFGYITNSKTMNASEVIANYKGLWQVEESFRYNKHNLEIRPVYHYKAARIEAHIAICFVSFVLMRTIEFKLRAQNIKLSPEQIRYELNLVSDAIVANDKTDERYRVPHALTPIIKKICQALGIHKERYTTSIK